LVIGNWIACELLHQNLKNENKIIPETKPARFLLIHCQADFDRFVGVQSFAKFSRFVGVQSFAKFGRFVGVQSFAKFGRAKRNEEFQPTKQN
jgi:hypothetical protein